MNLMNNIVILGDTHFGVRSDSLEFHKYYRKFYDEIFFPYLIENKIDKVFQLGDLFDRRKFINFNSLYLSRKYFFDKLKQHNITLHALVGNHDIFFRNTLEVNSPNLILKDYDNIRIYDSFETVNFGGTKVDVVPWICDDNQKEIFQQIKTSGADICFGHFEIDGFQMDRGTVHHGGLDRKELKKYDIVLSGHFHHKSNADNITYVGTPYELTWSDFNDPRGFHVLNIATRDLTFVQNPYRMFHKVFYDDGKQDFDFWKSYDFDSLKETYVKVVVLNKQNPYMFDNVIDNLYKSGVSDISIVEDFTDITIDNDQELIDQAEDTMTILGKFIDNLTLDVETNKLKKLMREIYIEALNVEKTE
jgi:DNA repair exonuclease SbcCD nuclease subunit